MSDRPDIQDVEQQSKENMSQVTHPLKNKASAAVLQFGAKIAKAMLKLTSLIIKLLLPYLLVIAAVALVGLISYFIVLEFRGTEKEYNQMYENDPIIADGGMYYTEEGGMTRENKIIRDFYNYFSGISLWKLKGQDNENFLDRSGDEYAETIDHYKREFLFNLNDHILLSLDDYIYEGHWRNPEQFIKPVAYNKDTFKLDKLVDSFGNVIVESEEEDIKTGLKTGDMIKSVRDYGLASILKYNEKEDYKQTLRVVGTYVAEEYWDDSAKEVKRRSINEPFDLVMDGYPVPIDIIDKVITFTGELEYFYEYQDLFFRELSAGLAPADHENKPLTEYHYDTHYEPNCEMVETTDPDTGEVTSEEVCGEPDVYVLRRYRSSDSRIVENIPVVIDTVIEDKGQDYFHSYVDNFEAYIPIDTINDEVLLDRIDYESFVFDAERMFDEEYGFEVGSRVNSKSYDKASQYFEKIKGYAEEFGIDPYIIVAMIAQESGGDSDVSGGIAQINFSEGDSKTASATNLYGEKKTIIVNRGDEKNTDIAIQYMVIRFAQLLDYYGDQYKALQAYNFGEGTMQEVEKASGSMWNTDMGWMVYREDGRLNERPGTHSASYGCIEYREIEGSYAFGDSCYIENVLTYYTGQDIKQPQTIGGAIVGFFKGLFEEMFPMTSEDKIGEKIDFIPVINPQKSIDILKVATSFNSKSLFSDLGDSAALSFYDSGFYQGIESSYYSYDDIVNMTPGGEGFIWPAPDGVRHISSPFGYRIHPIYKDLRHHNGIDIPLGMGQSVYAVADGTVVVSSFKGGYGYLVRISHGNGVETMYAHNSQLLVDAGDFVKQGQIIARAGSSGDSTGPHIHFEIRVNNTPVDPMPWITSQ